MLGRSCMCRRKSSGPNTEPCGTPDYTEVYLYIYSFIVIYRTYYGNILIYLSINIQGVCKQMTYCVMGGIPAYPHNAVVMMDANKRHNIIINPCVYT